MNYSEARSLFRDLELLNHLALFELGLVVEPGVNHPAFATTTCRESPWKIGWFRSRGRRLKIGNGRVNICGATPGLSPPATHDH